MSDFNQGDIWVADLGRLKRRPVVVHDVTDAGVVALMCSTSCTHGVPLADSPVTGLDRATWIQVHDPLVVPPDRFDHKTGYVPAYASEVVPRVVAVPRDYASGERYGPTMPSQRFDYARPCHRKVGPGSSSPTPQGGRSRISLYDVDAERRYTSAPETVLMPTQNNLCPIDTRRIPEDAVNKAAVSLRRVQENGRWTPATTGALDAVVDRNSPKGYIALMAGYRHRLIFIEAALAPPSMVGLAVCGYVPVRFFSFDDWTDIRDKFTQTKPDLARRLKDPAEAAQRMQDWIDDVVVFPAATPEVNSVLTEDQTKAANWLGLSLQFDAEPDDQEFVKMSAQGYADAVDVSLMDVVRAVVAGALNAVATPSVIQAIKDGQTSVATAGDMDIVMDTKAEQFMEDQIKAEKLGMPTVEVHAHPTTPEYIDLFQNTDVKLRFLEAVDVFNGWASRNTTSINQEPGMSMALRTMDTLDEKLMALEAFMSMYADLSRTTRRVMEKTVAASRAKLPQTKHTSEPNVKVPVEGTGGDPSEMFALAAELEFKALQLNRRRNKVRAQIEKAGPDAKSVQKLEAQVDLEASRLQELQKAHEAAQAELVKAEHARKPALDALNRAEAAATKAIAEAEKARVKARAFNDALDAHQATIAAFPETIGLQRRALEGAKLKAAQSSGPDTSALESEEQSLKISATQALREADTLRKRATSLVMEDD